ncbi:amino acid adenylation domain-containing protein [Anaeromicropila populeti]|uniref:Amino acid adenylation domain-containing protein n=2 Tax=Anaeromicropila populeti TaxID=37658 RepID=A0A1I6HPF2_9FIRM|nr:amino acid adenylation domain-containing protein [Anaeromicropila populeti]
MNDSLKKETEEQAFELSNVQLAYLMGREKKFELGGTSAHYYIELESEVNLEKFNRAINLFVQKHPTVRSVILENGKQQILKQVPYYEMEVEDLTLLSSLEQEKNILRERERMSHHIFDTKTWPLFEVKGFKVSEQKNYLFIGLDLLIADATSVNLMAEELRYFCDCDDDSIEDFSSEYTFQNFRNDCEELKNTVQYQNDKDYWMSKVDDFPLAPVLPVKQNLSDVKKPHFNRISKVMEKDYWNKIKEKCKEHDVRPTVVFCTAYAKLLAFWSNQPKLAINLTIANRYPFHDSVKNMVGDFTSIAPIDIDLQQGDYFWDIAKQVQNTLKECQEHNYYDGGDFVREFSKAHGLEKRAVMPIVLTSMMFGDHLLKWSRLGEVKFNITQTSQVYLDNQISREGDCVRIVWDYVEQLFEEEYIHRLFDQYIQLLNQVVVEENVTLSISKEDQELVQMYNSTAKEIQIGTLHSLFQKQALVFPDHIAVICENEQLTYKDLDQKSNQVANYLREQGIAQKNYVGIIATRRIETIVNIMGVLKAGAAYIPIEPSQPLERRNYILEDAGSQVCLDYNSYENLNINGYSTEPLEDKSTLEDVAYAIYTSGSTGKPKGVVISHSAAANTIMDINERFQVNETDRIIGLSSMCFDLSVYDIFGALSVGAALVMVPDQKDVSSIKNILEEYNITIWNSVPVIMDMLITHMKSCQEDEAGDYIQNMNSKNVMVNLDYNDTLRLVLLSGDWIPLNLPEKIQEKFISTEVISLGGATEAAIWSIYYPIHKVESEWRSIPYGMPLANQTFYVLDYKQQLCPVGVQGELYIGGKGVALEYLNDSEKTKNAFVQHTELGRLYKTGDYGKLHRNGTIEFLGRKDQQVKIRGHRIELGEIEKNILRDTRIANTIVVDRTDANNKKHLCAYIVSEEKIETDEMTKLLEQYLPDYMIPSHFVNIESIPLTANGKVNKKALPEINIKTTVHKCLEGRNETEKCILQIWREVLKMPELGICDDFFEMGGDSLNAMMIYAKMNHYFVVNFNSIYEYKTVEALSRHIRFKEAVDLKALIG